MTDFNSAANNLILGLAIAGTAQIEADNANQRASQAEERARIAELAAARKTTDRDLERRLEEATRREIYLTNSEKVLREEAEEKDALLLEWMHSNEAFKRLAKQYSKILGLDEQQHRVDFAKEALIYSSQIDPEHREDLRQ